MGKFNFTSEDMDRAGIKITPDGIGRKVVSKKKEDLKKVKILNQEVEKAVTKTKNRALNTMLPFEPYKGSEDSFQIAVSKFLNDLNILWTHIANERKTDVKTNKKGVTYSASGAKLKAKGVKRGVPDVLIFEPRGEHLGFAIELKVGKNTSTPYQTEWREKLHMRGWLTMESKSLDEVIFCIKNYLK